MVYKKNALGFPIDYGDAPLDDEHRLSHSLVKGIKSKRFRDIVYGIAYFTLVVGVNVRPTNAIPPEAGEHIAKAAAEAASEMPNNIPVIVQGAAGPAPVKPIGADLPPAVPAAGHNGFYQGYNGFRQFTPPGAPGGYGGPGGPPLPGQPPIMVGIPRPSTGVLRVGNTVIFAGSISWICLNAYWGNPIALIGCSGMVVGLLAEALGMKIVR
jgi:hypothetical protein